MTAASRALSRLQGQWRPGLPPWVCLAIQIVLGAQVFSRGSDYVTGDAPDLVRSLGTVEQSAPIWIWGASFIVAVAVLTLGMAMRQVNVVILGHAIAAGLYLGIGYGVMRHNVTVYGWGDGYRTATSLYAASIFSALLAIGTRLHHVTQTTKERVRRELELSEPVT